MVSDAAAETTNGVSAKSSVTSVVPLNFHQAVEPNFTCRYDGTPAVDVPWAFARPDTTSGYDLAIVKADGTVTDTDASQMTSLWCRKPATLTSYVYSTRFW